MGQVGCLRFYSLFLRAAGRLRTQRPPMVLEGYATCWSSADQGFQVAAWTVMGYHLLLLDALGLSQYEAWRTGNAAKLQRETAKTREDGRWRFVGWDRLGPLKQSYLFGWAKLSYFEMFLVDFSIARNLLRAETSFREVSAACGALFGGLLADLLGRQNDRPQLIFIEKLWWVAGVFPLMVVHSWPRWVIFFFWTYRFLQWMS